ncbi:lipase [Toxoplasma gondii MAS]|uniref:Lipase n=1 Tax=Toxoplasma gondii MAS TaxID=943118 RepID=A0A086Q598_TOXGO|nr:lipase [Toxoplasma gondii MAS]
MVRHWRSPTFSWSRSVHFLLTSLALFFLFSFFSPRFLDSSAATVQDAEEVERRRAPDNSPGVEASDALRDGDRKPLSCEEDGRQPCTVSDYPVGLTDLQPLLQRVQALPSGVNLTVVSGAATWISRPNSGSGGNCEGEADCAGEKTRAPFSADTVHGSTLPGPSQTTSTLSEETVAPGKGTFQMGVDPFSTVHGRGRSSGYDGVYLSNSGEDMSIERSFPYVVDEPGTPTSLPLHWFHPLYHFYPPEAFREEDSRSTSSKRTSAPLVWGARFVSPSRAGPQKSKASSAKHAGAVPASETRRPSRDEWLEPLEEREGGARKKKLRLSQSAEKTSSSIRSQSRFESQGTSRSSAAAHSSLVPSSLVSRIPSASQALHMQAPVDSSSLSHPRPVEVQGDSPAAVSESHAGDKTESPTLRLGRKAVVDTRSSQSHSASAEPSPERPAKKLSEPGSPDLASQSLVASDSRDECTEGNSSCVTSTPAAAVPAVQLPVSSLYPVVFHSSQTLAAVTEVSDLRRLGEDPLFDAEAVRHQEVCGGLFQWKRPMKGSSSDLACVWDRFADAFERTIPPRTPLPFRPGGFTYRTVDTVSRWYSRINSSSVPEVKSEQHREKAKARPSSPNQDEETREPLSSLGTIRRSDSSSESSLSLDSDAGLVAGSPHTPTPEKAKAVRRTARSESPTGILGRSHAFLSKASRLISKRLTSFTWGLVQRLVTVLKDQQREGALMNLGKAINSMLESEGVTDTRAIESALFLPLGCKSHLHYSELYTEGYDVSPTDPTSWPDSPFFAWLIQDRARGEMLLPSNLPHHLTVTVSPRLPADVEDKASRLRLYEMWHTIWFLIAEVSRSDYVWPWVKHKDVNQFFPWWTVATVALHRVTEHRPVRYATGVWRFKNIDPETLEVIPQPDGSESNPFEVVPPPRSHLVEMQPGDNLATSGGDDENPWGFLAEGLYANIATAEQSANSRDGEDNAVKPKTFTYRGKSLSIYPDLCGEDATFSYLYDAPFAMLFTPSNLVERIRTRLHGRESDHPRWRQPRRTASRTSRQRKSRETVQGNLVDAIWIFKPTTMPKMWLANRMAKPFEPELSLSNHPEALVHRGYGLLFRTSYRPRMEQFISQLTSPQRPSSPLFPSSSLRGRDAIWLAYQHRSRAHPFTLVFAGHSQGGVAAEMSAFFVAKAMKDAIDNGTVRVYVIVFGTPSWCTQKMYEEFRETGLVIHEVASSVDPVPFLFTSTGFVADRKMVTLNLEDLYKVSFRHPFPFDGSLWKSPRKKTDKKTRLISATLGIRPLLDPTLSFTLTHSHVYAASLGLLSQRYPHIGWASFLGYPLVPPEVQTVPSHTPEGMRGLQEGHRLLLMGAGVEPPKSSSAAARGLSLLRSLRLRKRSREPDEGEEPPKKRRVVDKTLPEHDADRQ